MRIHYLQHVPFEDLANIETWLRSRGHEITGTRFFAGEALPAAYEIDGLVVLGGPMSIHDEDQYPWLVAEKQFVEKVVDKGVPTLGICLGAQLIAEVLGGRVTRNPEPEIGWHPVKRTQHCGDCRFFADLPDEFAAFHWHGETFTIPPDCVHLAESEACRNQAFRFEEHVLGLQFHLESSETSMENLLTHCGDELRDAPYVQRAEDIRTQSGAHLPRITPLMEKILVGFEF
ncbi:MAG: type 1 glutamine amidotransferase [Candidatus Hydrogenedentes bacterium]|nr:type 1 glutamine amidotransferase [Candidatus Hydrogenedentota bacterium]